MRRAGAIIVAALSLSACASGGGPDGGIANLDALQSFQATCAARGMSMQLRPEGDAQMIQAYQCVRK